MTDGRMSLLAKYAILMGLLTVCQTPCRSKPKSRDTKPKDEKPSHKPTQKPVAGDCWNQKEWSEMVGRRKSKEDHSTLFSML